MHHMTQQKYIFLHYDIGSGNIHSLKFVLSVGLLEWTVGMDC